MLTGLYVHVPYCHTKCGYCDFYSVALGERRTAPLVDALLLELDARLQEVPQIDTIFVGGGTPTVLPLDDLTRLFSRLGEVGANALEFTTEANPATVDPAKIEALAACGVNRMSFGGQSLNREELRVLDRLHDPDDIQPGIAMARAGGIAEINLDLIFGIPGQTLDSWKDTLRRALAFETDHLSCYGLTFEPETAMTARMQLGMIEPCDNGLETDMFLYTIECLTAAGFEHYEISNYAKPGRPCRHNVIYWSNWPYLGIGPSAASYVGGIRSKNVAHIDTYVSDIQRCGNAAREHEQLTGHALAGETAMLQLRLACGIDIAAFTEQTGADPRELFADELQQLEAEGLIEQTAQSIRLTPTGRLVADRVVQEFLFLESAPRTACKHALPVLGG